MNSIIHVAFFTFIPFSRNYSNISNPDTNVLGYHFPECRSLWDHFKRVSTKFPENNFLGTRETGGPYQWINFRQGAILVD
jgi:hypothetical protein